MSCENTIYKLAQQKINTTKKYKTGRVDELNRVYIPSPIALPMPPAISPEEIRMLNQELIKLHRTRREAEKQLQ